MTEKLTCKDCYFWDSPGPYNGVVRGLCRVNPPDPNKGWVNTNETDWCGAAATTVELTTPDDMELH